jgi:acetoin utilization deacetylase AcuC-like enzyme
MKAFFTADTDGHDPGGFLARGRMVRNEERADRAKLLLAGLDRVRLGTVEPPEYGDDPLLAVHTPAYLTFLRNAYGEWSALPNAGPEVIPNVHPQRGWGSYPDHIVGRAGWHIADTAAPIGPGTARAVFRAADCAVAAADAVLEGALRAYALCRPPGHHAYADMGGGHCFINNSAVAAMRLRGAHARVAVFDIDVHHGNGTQGIFYDRADVMTVSIHTDPSGFYPFYCGHAHERGEGAGFGANLNLPLPQGSGDATWLDALRRGLAAVQAFQPGAMVLALGLDAHASDPFKGMTVSVEGFRAAGRLIGACPIPMAIVQEGGYLSADLTDTLAAFMAGLADA